MNTDGVETRIAYSSPVKSVKFAQNITKKSGWLFHRKDYHEDGSVSDFYGIELTKEEFLAMGGVELVEEPTERTFNPNITLEEVKKLTALEPKDYPGMAKPHAP